MIRDALGLNDKGAPSIGGLIGALGVLLIILTTPLDGD